MRRTECYTLCDQQSERAPAGFAVCMHLSVSQGVTLQAQYRLHGIVNHLGMGPSSGHFTADIFEQKSGRWLRHNDSMVSELASIDGMQAAKDCYMLVYVCNSLFDSSAA